MCAGESGKGNIVCVFILFISRCIFMSYTQALQAAERLKKKKRGRVREYSQFPSKKKIHLQLLM